MADVVSPSPKNRRRTYVVLGAVVVVVIGLIAGSFFYASSMASAKVSDYKHDFAAWEAKDESAMLAATAALPTDTFITSSDPGTAAALAKQKRACGDIASSLKNIKRESDRLRVLPSNSLFNKISSDYQAAGDTSARRAKVIRAYAARASVVLAQLHRDCSWNVAWNAAYGDATTLYKKSEKYLDPKGVTAGSICDYKEGCISSSTTKKNSYADLRIKAHKIEKKDVLSLLESPRCAATSYGEACRTLAKNFAKDLRLNLEYDEFVRATSNTVGSVGLGTRAAAIDKFEKAMKSSNRKAVLALNPHLKEDKDVVSDPDWSDNFFEVMGKMRLAELDGQRLALEKL